MVKALETSFKTIDLGLILSMAKTGIVKENSYHIGLRDEKLICK